MMITPAFAVALVILVALNAYVVLAGADFGGGVWDFFASGPRKREQRSLIEHAIAPIWEANHVWLILAIVLLFTCFPAVFSTVAIGLHIPLTLMLIGIVLRGSAFAFRSYGSDTDATAKRWGRVFAIASIVTPVLLGMSIGAVTTGQLEMTTDGSFVDRFVAPWLTPFTLGVGVLALALFSFLAAVYLTIEAESAELREDFRRRALWAAGAVFVAAFGVLALSWNEAPAVRENLMEGSWALPVHIVTGIAAVTAIAALWTRRYHLARIAAVAQVTFILWGWAIAQYPYLLPPHFTIDAAAAPERTLVLILWALLAGACVLFPSLYYLFRLFKLQRRA
jgi:cytochrome bd ubiquinol oxidase subunit II